MDVEFKYDDIYGFIKILEYSDNKYLTLKYDGEVYDKKITTYALCRGEIGGVINKKSSNFKYNIGEIFYDNKRYLTVTDRERKESKDGKKSKWYKYRCNKCSYEGWITENALKRGSGCPCCSSPIRKIVLGINTIWDTDRWMCDLGVSEEDAKKYTKGSRESINVVCPCCKKNKKITPNVIYNNKSIGCTCGDGRSYISKYIYNVLRQLNVRFDTEVKYDWNKYTNPKNNKISQAYIDFVIYKDGREIPLEADGGFHRKDNNMNGMTAEMHQYIDKQRDENCLKYLGEETIRISDEGNIRENILNSKLAVEFDLSNVDWTKCDEFALSNIVKEVCNYWNNREEWEGTGELVKKFNYSQVTIISWLKKGNELGWCYYDPKHEIDKNYNNMKKCVSVYENGVFKGNFVSILELERKSEELFGVKLDHSSISAVCLGRKKMYKGFCFEYAR